MAVLRDCSHSQMSGIPWILTLSLVLYLVCLCPAQIPHGQDISVCNTTQSPPGIPNRSRPTITNNFHTRIECVIVNKKKTIDIHEYFDFDHNRGFIEQTDKGHRFDALYSYKTDELITFSPDQPSSPDNCKVQELSTSNQRFLLGVNKINRQPHIFSANDALHLSGRNVIEVYMGVTSVRGIYVDHWRSCQYWKDLDATMTVDWYFSSKTIWDSAVGIPVPVQAHVTGRVYNASGVPHDFEHYYNFFSFSPKMDEIHSKHYETPAGLQCQGRKKTKKLPKVPMDAFSFTTEILDLIRNSLSFLKETFYYSQKLVKFEYRGNTQYGLSDYIEIHDFHSGVAYITDKHRGNCSFRKIETNNFDVRLVGPNEVRIRNSKEFFYFDSSAVTYEGVKKNRKIDCDTWTGKRNDYPFESPANSTWEWYFAAADHTEEPRINWQEVAPGPEPGSIPIQMRISVPSLNWKYQYNIYNFKKEKPDLLNFDISGCYEFRKRRKFQFSLPGKNQAIISRNLELFKAYVMDAVVKNTNISPVRVSRLQVFFADSSIIVTFELLDVSPIVGDTQRASDYSETPLDFAANTLTQMIQNSQFVIPLHGSAFQQLPYIVVLPESIIETTYEKKTITTTQTQTKKGYGAGPMAAVGVSMPILGVGLGAVFAYFFFR